MMKNIFLIGLFLISLIANSQTLDDKINDLTTKIAKTLNNEGQIKIAIYPFSYLKTNEQNLTMDIRYDVHEKLEEKGKLYSVMDRGTFDTYAKEHKLNDEGLIDETTAKKFGELIAADAYVTGKVYLFGSVIRIRVKVTNTETGEIISMQSEKLPIDYDMAQFLGIKDWEEKRKKAEENKSQNPDCAIENVGDYCFLNNSNNTYEVHLKKKLRGGFSSTYKNLALTPQSKMCFKNLKIGSFTYEVKRKVGMVGPATKYSTELKGEFVVKKCESRLQKIRPQNFSRNQNITKFAIVGDFFSVKIINPNYYPRQVMFTNKNGQVKSFLIGAKSTTSIQLVMGFYSFLSKTTFSNTVVQQTSFNLLRNKVVSLSEDHKN